MDNKSLFGQMCRESLLNTYDTEIASYTEPINCSKHHYQRVSEILGITVRKKTRTSTRFIILAVAAALLLSACVAYVIRDEIKGLLIRGDEDHLKITGVAVQDEENSANVAGAAVAKSPTAMAANKNEKNGEVDNGVQAVHEAVPMVIQEDVTSELTKIEEIYELNYVPEGYVMNIRYITPVRVLYQWSNEHSDTIAYSQQLKLSGTYIDNEGTIVDIEQFEHEVYYVCTPKVHLYVWYDGIYYNTLAFESDVSHQEVEKMIRGITIKETT